MKELIFGNKDFIAGLLVAFIGAVFTRLKEKGYLRRKGKLKDNQYFKRNYK